MRPLSLAFCLVILAAVGPARAATLPVSGTLRFALGPLPGPTLTGSGVGSSAGGIGSAATVPAGLVQTTAPVSVPITPPALGLSLITVPASPGAPALNAAGSFSPNGAMGNNFIANLFFTGGATAGTNPLNYVGGGGTNMALVTGIPVTLIGGTWTNLGVTAGNPLITTVIMVVATGIPITVTGTAFDNRTASGVGTVQLIARAGCIRRSRLAARRRGGRAHRRDGPTPWLRRRFVAALVERGT